MPTHPPPSRFHLPVSLAELRRSEGRDQVMFERWAPSYNCSFLQRILFQPTHEAVIAAAESAGAQHGLVLDVGCGTGLLLSRVAQTWPEAGLVGVDAASQMVEQAEARQRGNERFRFKVGQAEALPQDSASVDLAMSTVSFHHWTDQAAGLREIFRVLRPGGLFVLAASAPRSCSGRSCPASTHGARGCGSSRRRDCNSWLSTSHSAWVAMLITVGRRVDPAS